MKNFRVAIVGCGRWGINHLRTAVELFGNSVHYVCDISEENLKNSRKVISEKNKDLAKKIKYVSGIQDVLADSKLNSVIIATPAESHYSFKQAEPGSRKKRSGGETPGAFFLSGKRIRETGTAEKESIDGRTSVIVPSRYPENQATRG